MNARNIEVLLFAKTTILTAGLFTLLMMLYIEQRIIVPLDLAAIIAIVLQREAMFFSGLGLT